MYGQNPDQPGNQQPGNQGMQFGQPPVPPTMPGAPVPGMPGAPPPRKKSRLPVILAVAAGVVAIVAIAGVSVLVLRSSGVSGPLQNDQCVSTRFDGASQKTVSAAVRVECDDEQAKAKVLKIAREGERTRFQSRLTSQPDCPDGTDGVARVTLKTGDERYWEACLRNLKGPHPGDPGVGGALISKGDCVSGGTVGFGREKPCSDSGWYGKVIARVGSAAECPAGQTMETMKLRSFSGGAPARPVLCLGKGGQVLGAGDCIQDPSFAFAGLRKAACGTPQAVAKVEGRTKTRQECPAATTHVMEAKKEAYLKVLCLQKLRPTARERLDRLSR